VKPQACPFFLKENPHPVVFDLGGMVSIECQFCRARGPRCLYEYTATVKWNRIRVAPAKKGKVKK
jgi:hypothetical protein